ncbi:MAG: hypothetical protein FWF46_06550 [Oscillospiraceae bacterium]|nr:hypothetical protein [Oscillospiraceae bacterium]
MKKKNVRKINTKKAANKKSKKDFFVVDVKRQKVKSYVIKKPLIIAAIIIALLLIINPFKFISEKINEAKSMIVSAGTDPAPRYSETDMPDTTWPVDPTHETNVSEYKNPSDPSDPDNGQKILKRINPSPFSEGEDTGSLRYIDILGNINPGTPNWKGSNTGDIVPRNDYLYAIDLAPYFKNPSSPDLVMPTVQSAQLRESTNSQYNYSVSSQEYHVGDEIAPGKEFTAGEAYIMAQSRVDAGVNNDAFQLALLKLRNGFKINFNNYNGDSTIPTDPPAGSYSDEEKDFAKDFLSGNGQYAVNVPAWGDISVYQEEAMAFDEYKSEETALKANNNGQQIVDAMLPYKEIKKDSDGNIVAGDSTVNKNEYAVGNAGLVAYDESTKEVVVGPFSIDYIRSVLAINTINKVVTAGKSEVANAQNNIMFSSITGAKLYGLKDGKEQEINNWEFVYTNVKPIDTSMINDLTNPTDGLLTPYTNNHGITIEKDGNYDKVIREKEYEAIENGDVTPNDYPYPKETFYIKFQDLSFDAISKIEFTMSTMDVKATVNLLTPTVNSAGEVASSPKMYQLLSAEILKQQKTISLSLGNYITNLDQYVQCENGKTDAYEGYAGYCIPLTMSLGGIVWRDGSENDQYNNNIIPDGIHSASEQGISGVIVDLYDDSSDSNDPIATTTTGADGKYSFPYAKIGNKYYIEFEYDAIKYKSTDNYLVPDPSSITSDEQGDYNNYNNGLATTTSENINSYKNGYYSKANMSGVNFLNYLSSSQAIENPDDRNNFNAKYSEISGKLYNDNPISNVGQAYDDSGKISVDVNYQIIPSTQSYIGSTANVMKNTFKSVIQKSVTTKYTGLIYPLQPAYIVTSQPDFDLNQPSLSETDTNQYPGKITPRDDDNTFVLGGQDKLGTDYYSVITTRDNGEINGLQIQYGKGNAADNTSTTVEYTKIGKYMNNINLGLVERSPIDLAIKNDIVQTNTTLNEVVSDANINGFGTKVASTNNDFEINNRTDDGTNSPDNYFNTTYTQPLGYDEYNWRNTFVENSRTLPSDDLQLYVQYKITVKNQSELDSGAVTEIADYFDSNMYYPVATNDPNTNNVNTNPAWIYYNPDDPNTNYTTGQYAQNSNDWKGYADIVIPKIFPGDGNGNLMTSWAVKNEGTASSQDIGAVKWNSTSKFTSSGNNNNKTMPTGLIAMYASSYIDNNGNRKDIGNISLAKGDTLSIYVIFKVNQTSGYVTTDDKSAPGKVNIAEINSYKSYNYDGSVGGRLDIDSAPGNADISQVKSNASNQTKYVTFEDDTDAAPLLKVTVDDKNNGRGINGYVWSDAANPTAASGTTINQKIGNGIADFTSPGVTSLNEPFIKNVQVELVRMEYNKEDRNYYETPFTDEYSASNYITTTGQNDKDMNCQNSLHGEYSFNNLIPSGKYEVRFNYGAESQIRQELQDIKSSLPPNDKTIYNGHDYKSTTLDGDKRPVVNSQLDPNTEIVIVVNSSQMSTSGSKTDQAITGLVSDLITNLNSKDNKLADCINIVDCNKNYSAKIVSNVSDIGHGSGPKPTSAATDGLMQANEIIKSKNAQNNIIIMIQDEIDTNPSYVSGNGTPASLYNIKDALNGKNYWKINNNSVATPINIIGIGLGTQSLNIFKNTGSDNEQLLSTYTLSESNSGLIEQNVYDKVMASIIKTNFLQSDNNNIYNNSEDYLQNATIPTFNNVVSDGTDTSTVSVNGRLEVMKYSQDMAVNNAANTADTLNMDYLKTIQIDTATGSPWSTAINAFAKNTQMTAHSCDFSVDFKDNTAATGTVYTINLGLQEIPQTKLEVKDRVNSITVTLSNGQKIVDLKVDDNGVVTATGTGLSQNVQPIPRNTGTVNGDKRKWIVFYIHGSRTYARCNNNRYI